jgi:large subunit ribosomal protein L18
MDKNKDKAVRRSRRRVSIRKRIEGTLERPRLSIYKSLNHMYAQVIDDLAGKTIAAASTRDKDANVKGKSGNAAAAGIVGKLVAERAKKAGVSEVVFDRGGFRYHGRVKALAEGARKAGLKF